MRTLRGVHQRQHWCHRTTPKGTLCIYLFFLLASFFPLLVFFGDWAVLCASRPLPFENLTCTGQKKQAREYTCNPQKLGVAICIFNMKALAENLIIEAKNIFDLEYKKFVI